MGDVREDRELDGGAVEDGRARRENVFQRPRQRGETTHRGHAREDHRDRAEAMADVDDDAEQVAAEASGRAKGERVVDAERDDHEIRRPQLRYEVAASDGGCRACAAHGLPADFQAGAGEQLCELTGQSL